MTSQKFLDHCWCMNDMQKPEGRLIGEAIAKAGLSARQAAKQAGISDTRWRHIVNGYQPVGQGQKIEIVAPADTLMRMAIIAGVNSHALRDAGRDDAADLLVNEERKAKEREKRNRRGRTSVWESARAPERRDKLDRLRLAREQLDLAIAEMEEEQMEAGFAEIEKRREEIERKAEDDASQAEDQASSGEDVQGARDRAPMTPSFFDEDVQRGERPVDLGQHREKRRQDEIDSLNFGTPTKPGELDQGKLQPPPARNKSAAWEPERDLEGPTEARKSGDRGEENQDDEE